MKILGLIFAWVLIIFGIFLYAYGEMLRERTIGFFAIVSLSIGWVLILWMNKLSRGKHFDTKKESNQGKHSKNSEIKKAEEADLNNFSNFNGL